MLKKIVPLVAFILAILIGWFYFWGSEKAYDVKNADIVTFENSQISESDTITIVTYNVGYLSGMTNNLAVDRSKNLFEKNLSDFHKLMESISPNIVALQEVDFKSERSFLVNQFEEMGKSEFFKYGATAINWNKRYVPFPYLSPSTHFGKILSGQAVLSSFPITKNDRYVLPQPIEASFIYKKFYLDRLAQYVTLDVLGKELTVVNVHLEAFDDDTREVQAKHLIRKIKNELQGKPYILLGDFNTVPLYTPDKKYVSDEDNDYVKEKTLKLLLDSLDIKSAYPDDYALKDLRSTYTFPTDDPQTKIDHIYYTPQFIEPIEQFTVQENALPSDHLPVVLRFRLKTF